MKKSVFRLFQDTWECFKKKLVHEPPSEESADMWNTLETDVIEYLKNIESNESKLRTQVKNEFKESESDLLKIKMEPSDENNTNLLNIKTSALSKTHTDIVNNNTNKIAVPKMILYKFLKHYRV